MIFLESKMKEDEFQSILISYVQAAKTPIGRYFLQFTVENCQKMWTVEIKSPAELYWLAYLFQT